MTDGEDSLKEIDYQIAWVLGHPGMSSWLKTALGTALARDHVAVVNDLEILNLLLRSRSRALTSRTFKHPGLKLVSDRPKSVE